MNPISPRIADLTRSLLQETGAADGQHGIMADNLARHLAKTPEPYLERFEREGTAALPDMVHQAEYGPPSQLAPLVKIQRELGNPYTDAQVRERVPVLEARLKERLEEHHALNGSYPKRVWVVGSLLGGFGGNSDVDAIFDAGPKGTFKPPEDKDPQHQVEVMYLMYGNEAEQFRFFGSHEAVDPARVLRGENVLMPIYLSHMPSQRVQV